MIIACFFNRLFIKECKMDKIISVWKSNAELAANYMAKKDNKKVIITTDGFIVGGFIFTWEYEMKNY